MNTQQHYFIVQVWQLCLLTLFCFLPNCCYCVLKSRRSRSFGERPDPAENFGRKCWRFLHSNQTSQLVWQVTCKFSYSVPFRIVAHENLQNINFGCVKDCNFRAWVFNFTKSLRVLLLLWSWKFSLTKINGVEMKGQCLFDWWCTCWVQERYIFDGRA